eukprot:545917-Pelagomonas_calceolata.AAC.3
MRGKQSSFAQLLLRLIPCKSPPTGIQRETQRGHPRVSQACDDCGMHGSKVEIWLTCNFEGTHAHATRRYKDKPDWATFQGMFHTGAVQQLL